MTPPILLPESHAERLRTFVRESLLHRDADTHSLKMLAAEVDRSFVIADENFPLDIVTLGKSVTVEYLDTGDLLEFMLMIPGEPQEASPECLSVLSPLGLALLGTRRGDHVEWPLKLGSLNIRVHQVQEHSALGSASK